jgi:hypothetical protein
MAIVRRIVCAVVTLLSALAITSASRAGDLSAPDLVAGSSLSTNPDVFAKRILARPFRHQGTTPRRGLIWKRRAELLTGVLARPLASVSPAGLPSK